MTRDLAQRWRRLSHFRTYLLQFGENFDFLSSSLDTSLQLDISPILLIAESTDCQISKKKIAVKAQCMHTCTFESAYRKSSHQSSTSSNVYTRDFMAIFTCILAGILNTNLIQKHVAQYKSGGLASRSLHSCGRKVMLPPQSTTCTWTTYYSTTSPHYLQTWTICNTRCYIVFLELLYQFGVARWDQFDSDTYHPYIPEDVPLLMGSMGYHGVTSLNTQVHDFKLPFKIPILPRLTDFKATSV